MRKDVRYPVAIGIGGADHVHPGRRGALGLCLFPGDGDADGPDTCFSYGGFAQFRRRLAHAEGFDLGEMIGFGGDRPWAEVSTEVEPFLNHPDDHSKDLSPLSPLSPQDCAAVLPKLEAILGQWTSERRDSGMERHIKNIQRLSVVLRVCIQKNVDLYFG
ncbi:hypothetical protein ACIGBH_39625 [Streptomyces sp. NPDC085929]|uniref:hypothetical protein n=1 Tax=Streptomyces sp. NPDC085929 TaxID=3365739 RepID=UPI0037D61294